MFALGGNAVDAAVAAAFASFVAETTVVNLGGGGIAMVSENPGDKGYRPPGAAVYDFFTDMPTKGDPAGYDFRGITVDFGPEQQCFFIGRASTAVPGVVAGLCRMAHNHGRLTLHQLLEPAINLARKGFSMPRNMSEILRLLTPIYKDTENLRAVFASTDSSRKGQMRTSGEKIVFPDLATTLETLATQGADYFYKGFLAQEIVADHRANGGLITKQDLANYRVLEKDPINVCYRGMEVLLPPPASQGGILIGFSLKLLESISFTGMTHGSADHLYILAVVMALTIHARKAQQNDARNGGQVTRAMLSDNFVAPYRRLFKAILEGQPIPTEKVAAGSLGHTTHLSTLDSHGMAVSITTSAGESAGYLVGQTGVCLNNMLGELDVNPNGFHKQQSGTRMMTMMSPVVVMDKGKPVLSLGSAGSNRIRSAILQTMVNYFDFNLNLDQAINAPRIHYENQMLQAEAGIATQTALDLRQRGLKVNLWQERSVFFGGAQAVAFKNGRTTGAADNRRNGAVIEG